MPILGRGRAGLLLRRMARKMRLRGRATSIAGRDTRSARRAKGGESSTGAVVDSFCRLNDRNLGVQRRPDQIGRGVGVRIDLSNESLPLLVGLHPILQGSEGFHIRAFDDVEGRAGLVPGDYLLRVRVVAPNFFSIL